MRNVYIREIMVYNLQIIAFKPWLIMFKAERLNFTFTSYLILLISLMNNKDNYSHFNRHCVKIVVLI